MELKEFPFPELDALSRAFSTLTADKDLLEEAKKRGFIHGSPYNKLFSHIFYNGGTLKFKQDMDKDYVDKIYKYYRALASSWAPKHEHKEAICALLLSEICEPDIIEIKEKA